MVYAVAVELGAVDEAAVTEAELLTTLDEAVTEAELFGTTEEATLEEAELVGTLDDATSDETTVEDARAEELRVVVTASSDDEPPVG